MTLTSGARIGSYEVVAPLGAGGMGEVYRARDTRLHREVAIKVLPAVFAAEQGRLVRFEREAQVLAALNHHNIAQIYGVVDDPPALVMELVDGEDLSRRIARGALPLKEALAIGQQIAEALEAAHERGIIHRDLKPSNIKVRADGTVKVLDFGLGKVLEGSDRSGAYAVENSPTLTSPLMMTSPGLILGTAAYMSPEQARGHAVDKRSDIWAFGCVLFEMLTAHRPFTGNEVTDIVASIVKDEPAWGLLPSTLPAGLVSLLHRCLIKDPRHRLRDIGDALPHFEEAAAAPRRPTETRIQHPPLWPTATAVLAVAAMAFAVPAVRHLRERSTEQLSARFTIPPPENTTLVDAPVVSPDGQRIVFAAMDPNTTTTLWVRPLDSLSAKQLAGTEGAHYPFWSPDSKAVGFFAEGKLKRIDLTGAPPQTLAEAQTGRGGTWNQGDVILFEAANTAPLVRISASGGAPVPETTLDSERGETSHRFPHFLPDGRHYVYLANSRRQEYNAVYLGSLGSAARVRLVEGASGEAHYASGFLLYPRRSTLVAQAFDIERLTMGTGEAMPIVEDIRPGSNNGSMAFAVTQGGILTYVGGVPQSESVLQWFDRSGKIVGQVGAGESYSHPRLAPDGRSVAVTIKDRSGNVDVWIIEFAREVRRRLTSEAAIDSAPEWSRDGSSIYYFSEANNPSGAVFRLLANGSGRPASVVRMPTTTFPLTGSGDGQYLLYGIAGPKGSIEIWSHKLGGGQQPSLYIQAPSSQTQFSQTQAAFSPDSRWVAYTSVETGRSEIFLQSFPTGGTKLQVSISGGVQPAWRGNGRELFFVSLDQKLMAAPVELDTAPEIGKPASLFDVRLGADNTSIATRQYDVTADGRRFLFHVAPRSQTPSITLVFNWFEELKGKLPK